MEEQKLSEQQALDLIARVFEQDRRRMQFMRGELFIFWGTLFALSALAEYALLRWTGSVQVLWSWFVPIIGGYIFTVHNAKRQALSRTGFDDLLILIWGIPAMLSACSVVYAAIVPDISMNPVGITQLLLGTALLITAEFFRGKGSNQSGSFAALQILALIGIISAFNGTLRIRFDILDGEWLLWLAAYDVLLILLPGFILRHITRKQCSKS